MAQQCPVTVRHAAVGDCSAIVGLIKELAEYESLAEQVKITPQILAEDGFGAHAYYHCIVAEVTAAATTELVGYALFHYTYSTFQGKTAYLEDLYVRPNYRQKGIGSALLSKVAKAVLGKGCVRMDFTVLNWNKGSLDFYKRLGATDLTATEKWHLHRIEAESLMKLAES